MTAETCQHRDPGACGAAGASRHRPRVDVVVPFAGSPHELDLLRRRMARLRVRTGDTITIVDNNPAAAPSPTVSGGQLTVVPARTYGSSYFARNQGAARGSAEWILFLDADVEPAPDLIDRYFAAGAPADDVGQIAGAIRDLDFPAGGGRRPLAARYAFLRNTTAHDHTKALLGPFAKTANVLVRRSAFEQIGGFRSRIRSGGDVDLSYRLRAAGWQLDFRGEASADHYGRQTVRELLRQHARHGAGTAWLDGEYPGFSPNFRWSSLAVSLIRGALKGIANFVRRDGDRALLDLFDPLTALAFHLGRRQSNLVAPRNGLGSG